MCLVYNIIYQILSKQFRHPTVARPSSNPKASGLFRWLLCVGRHANNVDSLTMKNNLCCHCSWGAHHFNLGTHPFQSTWLACGVRKGKFTFWVWDRIKTNSVSSPSLAGRLVHWATESLKDTVASYIRFILDTRPALSARARNVTSVLYEIKTW